jgi:crotonobetainyl-CoA:carnitine CoA-transferase CaiB-like acyl-CoA transferase
MGGGEPGGTPGMPGVQIADLAGGALWSSTAILGALVGRARTGKGTHIDISMTEGALALLAAELGNLDCDLAEAPSRGNQTLNGGLACYRVYRTQDDKYLSVGSLEPKFWLALNGALGRKGDMGELVAPPAKQEAIAAELAAIFAGKTRDEWVAHLSKHDCCCEPVLELGELAEHPLHQERAMFFEMDGGDLGPVTQVRTPVGAATAKRLAPRHGEHSREVLAEYGFGDAEIALLLSK